MFVPGVGVALIALLLELEVYAQAHNARTTYNGWVRKGFPKLQGIKTAARSDVAITTCDVFEAVLNRTSASSGRNATFICCCD
jgi:hypothetical protein